MMSPQPSRGQSAGAGVLLPEQTGGSSANACTSAVGETAAIVCTVANLQEGQVRRTADSAGNFILAHRARTSPPRRIQQALCAALLMQNSCTATTRCERVRAPCCACRLWRQPQRSRPCGTHHCSGLPRTHPVRRPAASALRVFHAPPLQSKQTLRPARTLLGKAQAALTP